MMVIPKLLVTILSFHAGSKFVNLWKSRLPFLAIFQMHAFIRLIYSSKSTYACSKHRKSVKTVSRSITSPTYPANFYIPLLHLRTSSLPSIRLLGMAMVFELPRVSVGAGMGVRAAIALVASSLDVWVLAGVVVMLVRG